MLGDIKFCHDRTYIVTDVRGTWERLPHLTAGQQFHLWFLSRFTRGWSIADTRRFCRKRGGLIV